MLRGLVRRIRDAQGLTQGAFARAIGASEPAVRNWESGRNRPAPPFLQKMAELAPAFRAEIERELAAYEWHPGAGAQRDLVVPGDLAVQIRQLHESGRIDAEAWLRKIISAGLKSLPQTSRPSTTERAQRERENLERTLETHHERRRSRKAPAKRAG